MTRPRGRVDIRLDRAAIERLLSSPQGPVVQTLMKYGIMIERRAKQLCPVDTGNLRASINHAVGQDSRGPYVVIGSQVEYAIYQELGTRRMAAQPFLRPAMLAVLRQVGGSAATYGGGGVT